MGKQKESTSVSCHQYCRRIANISRKIRIVCVRYFICSSHPCNPSTALNDNTISLLHLTSSQHSPTRPIITSYILSTHFNLPNQRALSPTHLINTPYLQPTVGVYTDLTSPHAMGYQHMAKLVIEDLDIIHAITTDAGVRSHLGVVQDTVIVLKSYDEGRNDLTVADNDSFDLSSMREFIVASRL